MPAVIVSPFGPKPQMLLPTGLPAVGNLLFFYVGGSVNTKSNTYTDSTGTVANTNPIVLNSLGEPTNEIWFQSGLLYKVVFAPATDTDPPTSPIWTIDNLRGINDTTGTQDQWVASGLTPTFISATSFSLVGDQTSTFHVGRRVKTTNSGGTVYSTITASTFGAVTTIVVANDSGTLDAGLSAVSYGMLSETNDSMPRGIFPIVQNISKYIYGLTYANNVADATNDIDISAGGCVDSLGTYDMISGALTKRSDAAWAVGSGNGWLDTGAIGNSDYYIWTIARSDTGVVDSLLSLSATAPTMPANYDFKRLIGWFKRVGGTVVAFKTYEMEGGGLRMMWTTPGLDVNLVNTLGAARRTDAAKVPLNFATLAILSLYNRGEAANHYVWVGSPDTADVACTGDSRDTISGALANIEVFMVIRVQTSATGLVAARAGDASNNIYRFSTYGFEWSRR